MGRRRRLIGRAAVLALCAAIIGCKHNEQPAPPPRPEQARDPFETQADPPIGAQTRFAAGQFSESQANFANAAQQYELALQVEPQHRDAMFRLGIVLARLERYRDAIDVWQRYLKLTGGTATAYANLGFCYELAGQPNEAERTYVAGIRKDPRNESCRVNYGCLLARFGHVDEAMTQWRTVLTEAEAHFNLGSVYEQLRETDKARKAYQQALALDPGMKDARDRLNRL